MDNRDRQQFAEALDASLEVYGRDLSDGAFELWWRLLQRHSLADVQGALASHLSESPYPPKPADVLNRLKAADGRPGADEAWQYAVLLMDESATAWTNDDIDHAWGIAQTIYLDGDKVGARVAFRDAYNRSVAQAREQGAPVNWRVSLGHDQAQREQKLREAEQAGFLEHRRAQDMVGHQRVPDASVERLLSGPASDRDTARDWITEMRQTVYRGDRPDDEG